MELKVENKLILTGKENNFDLKFLPKLAVGVAGSLLVHGEKVSSLHQEDVDNSTPGGSAQPFGCHLQTPATIVSECSICIIVDVDSEGGPDYWPVWFW